MRRVLSQTYFAFLFFDEAVLYYLKCASQHQIGGPSREPFMQ